jgi:hypothetical protein
MKKRAEGDEDTDALLQSLTSVCSARSRVSVCDVGM